MIIAVRADEKQKEEFFSKGIPAEVKVVWVAKGEPLDTINADAYFDLLFGDVLYTQIENKIVLVNAVTLTTNEISPPCIRINAWPGFLQREVLEFAAANDEGAKQAEQVFQSLDWKFERAPDVCGMISSRIICNIINEAYYAFGEGISSKDEIDTAMKLGTNYPYGPFEWSEKIGLKNVYHLLKKLRREDGLYTIAPRLKEEVNEIS